MIFSKLGEERKKLNIIKVLKLKTTILIYRYKENYKKSKEKREVNNKSSFLQEEEEELYN